MHKEIIVDENGKVCGLLFGSIEDGTFLQNMNCYIKASLTRIYILKKWIFGKFGDRGTAHKIFSAHTKIEASGEKDADLFDGEVNLFIVSKELRGKQFGYRLMNNYVDFCRENNLNTIFLWTELSCTYSFYERYGFKRYSTFYDENLTDGKKATDNGFVYCYELNNTKFVQEDIK